MITILKYKKAISTFLVIAFFLGSCNVIKTVSLLKSGSVDAADYAQEIPFDNTADMIIIPVAINGKTYQFIFDTGAPCVISKELAKELGLEAEVEVNSSDSGGNTAKTGFTELAAIKIGGITFSNIGVALIDLEQIKEMQCLGVDGIIGANLMKTAKWKIDYQEKVLTFTDHIKNLNVTNDYVEIEYTPSLSGTPEVEVTLSPGVKAGKVIFDTGFMGELTVPSGIYTKLRKSGYEKPMISGYGTSSAGAYGRSTDTSKYLKIDNATFGELTHRDVIVEFKGDHSGILGNRLLSNYEVVIDWEVQKIYMKAVIEIKPSTLSSFGFKPLMKENKLVVGFLYDHPDLSGVPLHIGDQILAVNGTDYTHLTHAGYCEILIDHSRWENLAQVEVSWMDAEGVEHNHIFEKLKLLE